MADLIEQIKATLESNIEACQMCQYGAEDSPKDRQQICEVSDGDHSGKYLAGRGLELHWEKSEGDCLLFCSTGCEQYLWTACQITRLCLYVAATHFANGKPTTSEHLYRHSYVHMFARSALVI